MARRLSHASEQSGHYSSPTRLYLPVKLLASLFTEKSNLNPPYTAAGALPIELHGRSSDDSLCIREDLSAQPCGSHQAFQAIDTVVLLPIYQEPQQAFCRGRAVLLDSHLGEHSPWAAARATFFWSSISSKLLANTSTQNTMYAQNTIYKSCRCVYKYTQRESHGGREESGVDKQRNQLKEHVSLPAYL